MYRARVNEVHKAKLDAKTIVKTTTKKTKTIVKTTTKKTKTIVKTTNKRV